MNDVWELETLDEIRAIQELEGIIAKALSGNRINWWARDYLVSLWDEKWEDVRKKLETDSSTGYVWWMNGVRKHLAQSRKRIGGGEI